MYYNVKSLSYELIEEVLKANSPVTFRFTERPEKDFWKDFNSSILDEKKDVTLRLSGSAETWSNLDFIGQLYNLRKIEVDPFNEIDLSPLVRLKRLKNLRFGFIDWDTVSIEFLEDITTLEVLTIGCKIRGFHSLKALSKLTAFSIFYNDLDDSSLSFFPESIEALIIYNCEIKSLRNIVRLRRLRLLELGNIKNLDDLSPITSLNNLLYLSLENIMNVKSLPDFRAESSLKRLVISDWKELVNVETLKRLLNLEEISIYKTNLSAEELSFLLDLDNLTLAYMTSDNLSELSAKLSQKGVDTENAVSPKLKQLRSNFFR